MHCTTAKYDQGKKMHTHTCIYCNKRQHAYLLPPELTRKGAVGSGRVILRWNDKGGEVVASLKIRENKKNNNKKFNP